MAREVAPDEWGNEDPGVAAFMQTFWHHAPAVHAYLRRRAGGQVADDLFGEVWLRAFRARATYEPRGAGSRPWLFGIARNTLRAHWERHSRAGNSPSVELTDPWEEADGRLDAQRGGGELRHALSLLSGPEREILLLVAWEHLTPAEAAEVLGIPQGTARSRLHRARHLVRAQLERPPVVSISSAAKETAP